MWIDFGLSDFRYFKISSLIFLSDPLVSMLFNFHMCIFLLFFFVIDF